MERRAILRSCAKLNKGAGNFAKSTKVMRPPQQQIQRIDERDESSNDSTIEEDKLVLTIEGDQNGQFTMSKKINGYPFKTMVDSGSPVTIFGIDEIKKILKRKTLFIRELPESEEYVDFNKRKLRNVFCQLEAGKSNLQKARMLVAEKGAKSLIGRDWLNAFNYRFVSPNQKEGNSAIYKVTTIYSLQMKTNKTHESGKQTEVTKNNHINEQIKLKKEFEDLFERQGKLVGHDVKIEFKTNSKMTQLKGRRVPIQLQKAVEEEIIRYLEEGHIERVTEVTDKEFIQPVVITVKRDKSVKIALDARTLNNEIIKDKYRMPNLGHLVDMVVEQLDKEGKKQAFYTRLAMRYAYGQDPLDKETSKHCIFQIIGGGGKLLEHTASSQNFTD